MGKIKWTEELIKIEALKYETKDQFWKNAKGAHTAARRLGIFEEVCSHMKKLNKPKGYWKIKKNCQEEALKYNTISEFKHNASGAYYSALKYDWLNEFIPKK